MSKTTDHQHVPQTVRPYSLPNDIWVSDNAHVAHSGIEGRGLVAIRPIGAGEIVARLGGKLVKAADFDLVISAISADPQVSFVDSISIDDGTKLVLPPGSRVHFVNHRCDPNVWYVHPYEFVARHDINCGEEVTIDYATLSSVHDDYAMLCTCQSEMCRTVVTNDDWQLPELQSRYGDHWVPGLLRRVAATPGAVRGSDG